MENKNAEARLPNNELNFELVEGCPTFFAFGLISDKAVQQCIDAFNVLIPTEGKTGNGINKKSKDSLDTAFPPNNCMLIQEELDRMCDSYYSYFNMHHFVPPLAIRNHFNVQKYPINGGYHNVHTERGYSETNRFRELVWMTYLNDVPAGGETFWPFYNKKIKPKRGYTVIWPAFWMHAHHGIKSATSEKMIATGWFETAPY